MQTFWRLLGFLRPYRGGVAVSFVLAAAAMGAGVLVPYLVGRTIDEIRQGGGPLAARPGRDGAGLLRLAFSVSRRLVAGRVSLGVEYDLRNRIYSAPALARARVLRRPADRPADVALDRGPAGGALLPRLWPHLHPAVGPHDPDRGRRDARGRSPARRRRARSDAVRDLGGLPLRAPQPAGHAGGAAADSGADGGRRGERVGRPRGQGVRAGGAPAAALQAVRRARVRPIDDLHAAARVLLAVHRLPAAARARGALVRGRAPGDRGPDQHRRVRGLLRLRADADLPHADARHRARHGPAGGGERRARVRDPRPRAAADRPRRPGCRPAAGGWSCAA